MPKKSVESALGRRIKEAMERREITESELVTASQRLAAGHEHEELRAKLSQQMINHLITAGGERSFYTPIIAAALNVHAIWLAFGIGPSGLDQPRRPKFEIAEDSRERELLSAFRAADPAVQATIELAINSQWQEARREAPGTPKKSGRRVG